MTLTEKILLEFEYGEVLLGQDFGKFQNLSDEPDTSTEEELKQAIEEYVLNNELDSADALSYYWNDLVKLKYKFPKILHPSVLKVYRGTGVDIEEFKNIDFLRLKNFKQFVAKYFKKVPNDLYQFIHEFKYSGNVSGSQVTSWTSELFTAAEFAYNFSDGGFENNVPVILEVKINTKNFLFNPDFMNIVSVKNGHPKESEVLCNLSVIDCNILLDKSLLMDWWEIIKKLKEEDY